MQPFETAKAKSVDWLDVWNNKATQPAEFQANGRGLMDIVGFLYTLREIGELLDLRRDDAVLDIGCGTGIIALGLCPWVARIHGVDPSPNMVARAARNGEGVANLSFASTGLPDLRVTGPFDKVLMYSTLQYLADDDAVRRSLAAIAAVLPSGGRALLAANPDPRRQDVYRRMLQDADLSEADRRQTLAYIDATLWLHPDRALELASGEGFRGTVHPLHPRIWQHPYMYNLVLWRG
jgi:SAM-dependent methyltransferase